MIDSLNHYWLECTGRREELLEVHVKRKYLPGVVCVKGRAKGEGRGKAGRKQP